MSDAKPALRVWVFSDGRPGHFNQSHGLLKVLSQCFDVEARWMEVRLRVGIARRLLRYLLNMTSAPLPDVVLNMCYRCPELPSARPNLIISAGGKTSFINAALARRYACPNVFSGSLRGLSDRHFGTVFTLEPVPGAKNNTVLEHIPTTVDPKEVQLAGQALKRQLPGGHDRLWAMVIGGDGAGYRYTSDDWRQLALGMSAQAQCHGIGWLLTTSPRTGAEAEQLLRSLIPAQLLADATWYQSDPRKTLKSYMGAAEVVFCTEDSMSMITEGVASGKGVFTLSPGRFRPEQRYLDAIGRMETRGRIKRRALMNFSSMKIDRPLLGSFRPSERSSSEVLLPHLLRVLRQELPKDATGQDSKRSAA